MDWIKKMNSVLTYIEENLEYELDSAEAAKLVNSSKFHFLRIFSILTGKTFGEYIRERRMSVATKEIMTGRSKIIDIAFKYRYDSPEAFSKAFKRFHNVSPSHVREAGIVLNAAPPLYFSITVQGEEQVKYIIEKKEVFKTAGKVITTTAKDGENYKVIPEFWKKVEESGEIETIGNQSDALGILGICYNFNNEKDEFSYMIGIKGSEVKGIDFSVCEVPAFTWAIFPGKGRMPDDMQSLWKRIFSEWFPATHYELEDGPQIEVYLSNTGDIEEFEIWVPVKSAD